MLYRRDDVPVVALLPTVRADYGRTGMRGTGRKMLHALADAGGLPLIEATTPSRT